MDAAQLRPLMALRVSSGSQAATSSVAAPQRGRSRQPGRSRGSSQLAARATQRPGESQSGVFGQITDKQRAGGMMNGFQTFSMTPVGRVVCTSKGCRPVSEAEFSRMIDDPLMLASQAAMQRYESALLDNGGETNSNYPLLFAHFVCASFQGETLVERIYEEALRASPNDPAVLCAYADYLVHQAGDAARASKLYQRAVEADTTATALATYAHFLFRNPCQDAADKEDELWDLSSVQSFLAANAPAGTHPQ